MWHEVTGLAYDDAQGCWRVRCRDPLGEGTVICGAQVISSAPLRDLADNRSTRDGLCNRDV